MSINSTDESTAAWHEIGAVDQLKSKPCRKLYMPGTSGLALFHAPPDRFFLSDAACPHARGPLDQGDIEDVGGKVKVTCPLHFYTFGLTTGDSASGLRLGTYPTEVRDGVLYGFTPAPVSLTR